MTAVPAPPRGPLADPAVRSVALVRLRVGLGDLLCSEPALRLLRAARPDVRLTMITWPEMAEVVARVGHCDELLPFPGYPGVPDRPVDPAAWEPFVAAARARRFDLAVQCYGDNPAANAVTGLLGARHVAGFAPTGWDPARDPGLHLAYPRDLHEVDRHLRLVELLGVPVPGGRPLPLPVQFPVGTDDEVEVAALLAQHELEPGGYAVLHPGASSPSRRWPADRYARVADGLAAEGLRVVLTGVERERGVAEAVRTAARTPVVDLTAGTSLGGLAALLRAAAVVVSNDTGTAHLAAAVGTPSVTAFLPGDPVRWSYPSPLHPIARADVGCNPCPHLDCPIDHRCATRVTADQVLRGARAARAASRAAGGALARG